MDVVYYLSVIVIFLIFPAALTALIWPGFYSKILKQHATRPKIIGCLMALFFVFGSTLVATEPQSIKDARLAAEKQAALDTQHENPKAQSKPKVQAAKVETKTETKKEIVPFTEQQQNDTKLLKGQSKISQNGINGEKTLTYKVTYTDGKETKRELVSEVVSTQPVNKITLIGTYVAPKPKATPSPTPPNPSCDPNYSDCVPIASDVDCAGGEGDGPAYFSGTARVIGTDIYKLDRDKNGYACD